MSTDSRSITIKRGARKHGVNVIPAYANVILHIILLIGCACSILPLFMIISASLTENKTLEMMGYSFLPRDITFSAYNYLFRLGSFVGIAYRNTITATVLGRSSVS